MKRLRIQATITAGRWTLPAVIVMCIICWITIGWSLDLSYNTNSNYAPLPKISSFIKDIPTAISQLISFMLYAVIGYFLIEINNVLGIISIRASLLTSFYFLFITACPAMHLLFPGSVASIAFLFGLFFFFKRYHQHQSSGYLFYSFLFIGL